MLDIQQSSILIVDDIPTNIRVLLNFLECSGFKVAIAKNAESAFAKARRILPDLIILDVMMPGMDGFEACRHLKADPQTCDIPIIFMTALSDEVDKVKGLKLGAVDYVTKPIHNEEVLARIRVHLSLHQTQNHLMREVAERRQAELKLQAAMDELKQTQVQLVQSEKMSSLGQLVAGVAHEINNPTNFIYGNLNCIRDYTQTLIDVLQLYQKHYPQPVGEIQQLETDADVPFLIDDLAGLLQSMESGTVRIRDIVKSLKHFSRLGEEGIKYSDLHTGIESSIQLLSHRLKADSTRQHDIQIIRNYGDLPLVECYPNQINQVVMNIMANAIESFDCRLQEKQDCSSNSPNQIKIGTQLEGADWAVVTIADNGFGIEEASQSKLFDPFFTTKKIGKGLGLGLSISYQVIVNQHQGTIECVSRPNEGTTVSFKIPVTQSNPTMDHKQ